MLKSLTVEGYRGFATEQSLRFAQPNGKNGSGLTIVVGPNNGGKSTVMEAIRILTTDDTVTFTEGKRNKRAGDRVRLQLNLDDGRFSELKTAAAGGASLERVGTRGELIGTTLGLPPRRHFPSQFTNVGDAARDTYAATSVAQNLSRGLPNDSFTHRLHRLHVRPDLRANFERLLARVFRPALQWTLDQTDSGHYYLKITGATGFHSSEGTGDGFLNAFFLIDALYDSEDGHAILVDEPEVSLHPSAQRRLCELFLEYSATRQIIVATHSPYFLPMEALSNGMHVARVFVTDAGTTVREWSAAPGVAPLLADLNNPHVFGLDAREVFFLDDGVILVEGQEDVVFYRRMVKDLGQPIEGTFYGWGVGGAPKMRIIAGILDKLGFRRVAGVLDGNVPEVRASLELEFPHYKFFLLPAHDIRTKPPTKARGPVEGLFDSSGSIPVERQGAARDLIARLNAAMCGEDSA